MDESEEIRASFEMPEISKEKLPNIDSLKQRINHKRETELVRKQSNAEDEIAIYDDSNFKAQNLQGRWFNNKMTKYHHPGTF